LRRSPLLLHHVPSSPFNWVPKDEWDDLLSAPVSLDSSSPSAVSPLVSSSSGEFNVFLFVGSAVSAGWVGGPKPLFVLPLSANLCLGTIGTSKIYIKPCVDNRSCGIPTHATRKAKVEASHFYVHENENKIFSMPKYPTTPFTNEQIAVIFVQVSLSGRMGPFLQERRHGDYS